MMEAEAQSQDVNVYITVDRESLENYQNSRRKPKRSSLSWSQLIEDLGLKIHLQAILTPLGALMVMETVFSLTLLLFSTICPKWRLGYGGGIYAMIANIITFPVCLLHIAIIIHWSRTDLSKHQRFILALRISSRVILLTLQFASFVVMIACHDGYDEQTAFIVLTLIFCILLTLSIIHNKEEYVRSVDGRKSVARKPKLRRGKQKGYKRLSKSGHH